MNTLSPLRLPEAFETGIPSIDDEHLGLIESLNVCLRAQEGDGIKEFQVVFECFISDLKRHFNHEEALMREAGYPGLEDHANHHRSCLNELNKSLENCAKRGYADRTDVAGLFHNLIGVIVKADLKFVEYLWGEDLIDSFMAR